MHAGLAAGAALAALPVILHLFMRPTPKKIIFPALRLIRERQKRDKRSLKVRNWLLLLARMLLLAFMALALARPRLSSQTVLGDEEVPTALGLVFDTSLSMGYKERDKTRLGEAKERALEILRKTPETSQVFVVDAAEPGVPAGLPPAAARKRVESLALRASKRTLNAAVGLAYTAVSECERPRREVYVLTDLARSAWDVAKPAEGLEKVKLDPKAPIATFVLRLSPKEVRDVAVCEAGPSVATPIRGEPLEIHARLRAQGPAATRVVELVLDGRKREQKTVEIPADGEVGVTFITPKLDEETSLHQGEVRLTGEPDPLEVDDVAYFSFQTRPAIRVLVLSDLAVDSEFVAAALDPDPATLKPGRPRLMRVERATLAQLPDLERAGLSAFGAIYVVNAARLDEADWGRLNVYVREGGGLIVAVGDRADAENYNGPAAAALLPATLKEKKTAVPETTFGKPVDNTQPLFALGGRELEAVLAATPVYKYWTIKPSESARTLLPFADGAPALLERTFKGGRNGRVLLWTTPLARRVDRASPAAWNDFPFYWGFLALQLETVPYLLGAHGEKLDFDAGDDVLVPIDPTQRLKNYLVRGPENNAGDRLSPAADSDALHIVAPQQIGNWTVTGSGDAGVKQTLGFSLNPPERESRLAAMAETDLDNVFGKGDYMLAEDAVSFNHAKALSRLGRELFPYLMFLILIIVTLESVLANRFYREPSGAAVATAAGTPTRLPTAAAVEA